MSAKFTIILPHRRNKGNDTALKVCLDCLFTNTVNDFHLLIDAAADSPLYPRINALMAQATTDCVVYAASDVFAAPNWDVPMLAMWQPDTIVNGVIVEPGVIGVHHWNLHKDFGKTPETFQREKFEGWVAVDAPMLDGWGWYTNYMISRSRFLEMGSFVLDEKQDFQGFSGADELFFNQWLASGKSITRVQSYFYHLQRYSVEEEQFADKRKVTP